MPKTEYFEPKILPTEELPTGGDIIRYAKFLSKDQPVTSKFVTNDLVKYITEVVKAKWIEANPAFCEPKTLRDHSIKGKVKTLLEKSFKCEHNHLKSAESKSFVERVNESLFDILKCKCKILRCSDGGCQDFICDHDARIWCICQEPIKIPSYELNFIWSQRNKNAGVGLINLNNKKEPVPITQKEIIFDVQFDAKMKVDSGNEIRQHLQNLYLSSNDHGLFDVKLQSSNGILFKAHSIVLTTFSGYFKKLHLNDVKQDADVFKSIITLPISDKVLSHVLDFLYLGGTTFPKKILSQVYEASKFLRITSLSTLVSPHSQSAAALLSKQGEKRKREEQEDLEHKKRLQDFFGDSDDDQIDEEKEIEEMDDKDVEEMGKMDKGVKEMDSVNEEMEDEVKVETLVKKSECSEAESISNTANNDDNDDERLNNDQKSLNEKDNDAEDQEGGVEKRLTDINSECQGRNIKDSQDNEAVESYKHIVNEVNKKVQQIRLASGELMWALSIGAKPILGSKENRVVYKILGPVVTGQAAPIIILQPKAVFERGGGATKFAIRASSSASTSLYNSQQRLYFRDESIEDENNVESMNEDMEGELKMESIDIKTECLETDTFSSTESSDSKNDGHIVIFKKENHDQSNLVKQELEEDPLS